MALVISSRTSISPSPHGTMTRTLSKHTITFIWWQITGHTHQEQTTGTYHWVYQMIHLIPGKFFTCCRPWWISRGSTADDAASRPSATSPFQCSTWQARQQSTRARACLQFQCSCLKASSAIRSTTATVVAAEVAFCHVRNCPNPNHFHTHSLPRSALPLTQQKHYDGPPTFEN